MPTYEITGIVKSTGKNRRFTLDAHDQDHAYELAADRDVMVATCETVADISPAELRKAKADPFGNYTKLKKNRVPDYMMLQVIGAILTILGILGCIISVIGMLALANQGSGGFPIVEISITLPWFLSGVFTAAAGQGIYAFRDIARNSWRSANAAEAD